MKCFIFLVFFCCCATQSYSESAFQSWVTDPRYSLYPSLPNIAPNSQNEMCKAHSQEFLSRLRNKTLWALQMWDSCAKAPVGIISGSIYHFGNFDECLRTPAPFEVQFCMMQVFANISLSLYDFRLGEKISPEANAWTHIARSRIDISKVPRDILGWGLCAPASCKGSDLQESINSHIMSLGSDILNGTSFGVLVFDEFCTKPTDYIEFTTGEITFWVVFFTLVLLTVFSTLIDLLHKSDNNKHSKMYDFCTIFSINRNLSHLIPSEKQIKNPLDVFHGIKFVSILFILYGHRVGVAISLSTMNYNEIEDYLINDHKMFFVHTDLVVDTFFYISGLLASYVMMNVFAKRFINPLYLILVRISRLAPLYFFIIWFQSTAAYRMGSGPLWRAIAKNETEYCVDHWWSNVFFFSNYYKTDEMCLPHSWFLPCEIHFFILAVILLSVIMKYQTFGRVLLGVVTIGSAIIPAAVIYINKIQPLILFYYEFLMQPRKYESFNQLYIKTHNRATVYLIGMIVGLFLYHKKNCKTRISKKLTLLGVLAWLAFLFAPMAYGSLYYNINKKYNVIEATLFGTLRRVSWAIGFSIFTLAHRFGTIPLIDFIFSSKLAVVCSKLTYGIYLIHFILITTDILTVRTARVFSIHNVVVEGLGDILKSVSITLLLFAILEIPLKRILTEFIFEKRVEEIQKSSETQNVCNVRL